MFRAWSGDSQTRSSPSWIKVIERPNGYPEAHNDPIARTASLRPTFPFRVYFKVVGKTVHVLAVYNTNRDQNRWNDPTRD